VVVGITSTCSRWTAYDEDLAPLCGCSFLGDSLSRGTVSFFLAFGGDPVVDALACIGRPPEHREHRHGSGPFHHPVIAESATVEAFCTVDAGITRPTRIGSRSWLMKGCHVGHDAELGDDCELAPHCSVGGHVELGHGVRVGQGATFKPFTKVGDGARIGMGAVVIRDVPAGEVWAGNPAKKLR
jgi:acyl-[acyl carrier protein]--UDP-N-acetylglucosamine O-acyltransferase